MNLQGIVSGLVSAINPSVPVTVMQSVGYATISDGTQTPAYQMFPDVPAQIQALSYSDIIRADALAIQGTRKTIFLNGNWEGLNRPAHKGGDMIIIPPGAKFAGTWLIAFVAEAWPDWTRVVCTLQMDGT